MMRLRCGALALACAVVAAAPLTAQGSLSPVAGGSIAPAYQHWSFGRGMFQRSFVGGDSVEIESASQWTLPIAVSFPLGDAWTIDGTAAHAWGTVKLRGIDPSLNTDRYQLDGLTDVRVGLSGRLLEDHLVFTASFNAATGKTELNEGELDALRVLASPALSFGIPSLGGGTGGSVGVVGARQYGEWSVAAGASYELRGTYSPVTAFTVGAPSPDFRPGDAIHLSLGTSGAIGQSHTTLTLAADFFRDDKLTFGSAVRRTVDVQLGPVLSADWQYLVGTTRLRELRFFIVDRYRTRYSQDGASVAGTSGNYLDAGIHAVRALSPSTGLSIELTGRHQTGLSVDRSLTTAGVVGGGLGVGLMHDLGDFVLQPFVRAQYGRFDMKTTNVNGTALGAGVTFGARF
ncbi:MAG: hypothetical protein M3081_01850 [Gemmatimonadota bacterium]|nr:hypothetical protein [Gemmatimonadota bacterium]